MAFDRGSLVRTLAKTTVAVVLGGPLSGIQELSNAIFDLPKSDPVRSAKPEVLVDRLAAATRAFATGERLPDGLADRVLEQTTNLLARYGLTAAELASVAFDPAAATAIVRARAAEELRALDEADEALCLRLIDDVHTELSRTAADITDLASAYQRRVLADLRSLTRSQDELLLLARLSAQHLLTVGPTPRWEPALYPPSALLRAEFAVVPFWGRQDMLDDLTDWASGPARVAARVYTGAGGMGKTRLLLEACRRMRLAGWRSGFVRTGLPPLSADQVAELGRGVAGVLLVVDYGETRTAQVVRLVAEALDAGVPVRIVLLARSDGDWLLNLRQQPNRVGDFLDGPAMSVLAVPPLATDAAARRTVFDDALTAFAAARGEAEPNLAAVSLDGPHHNRVLYLHMSALAALDGEDASDDQTLLRFALRREQGFWDRSLVEKGYDDLAGKPVRQVAALATLVGELPGPEQAVELFRRAPLMRDRPATAVTAVADLLHDLYPAESWLGGVQPDLLGEHLVGTALRDTPTLLAVLNGA
ncbi:hypothetical protein C1I95_08740 [Micromonospora craterilacus]|uniref:Uncharacterized protein n=1 Tax=Micromonospora craterilacus TaxID=1655439 RepID=A0A2W2F5E1_9ACTN|nr:hypothetical protein [Micromonospora craterilacus]PZG20840.1 hypothetical protein C1I95_08740 [Micromonospora craterilacus]